MAPRTEPPAAEGPAPDGFLREVLSRDGWPVLAACAATIAVELGVYILARAGGAPKLQSALAALAVAAVWVALAAPVLGASGSGALAALLRGGCVLDASAVLLIVLWLACDEVTLLAAVKIYCILAAMGLAGIAAGRLARSAAGRYALGVAAAVVLTAMLASPFWIGGAMRAASGEGAKRILTAGVHVNGFYGITAALADEARFIWHEASVMYYHVARGYYSGVTASWYAPVLIHLAAAVVLAAAAWLIHRPGTST
jgi:hypothetical protein